MNEILDSILEFIEAVPPVLRIILTGVAIMLETSVLIGLVVPGDTIVLVSSTGVTTVLEFILTVVAVIIGSLLGSSFGFWIGRLFGPALRGSWLGTRVGEDRWHKADRFVKRRGGIAVFISRFLPVFHSLVPLTAGMSVMPYRTFMAWLTPASITWAFLYVSIGSGAAETYRELKGSFDQAGWIFIGIFVVAILLIALLKAFLNRFAHTQETLETAEIMLPDMDKKPKEDSE
jgi:membrane protein DedA with SNARE-associated domain